MPTVKREDTYDTQDGAPLRPQRERRLPRAGRGTAARAYDIQVTTESSKTLAPFEHGSRSTGRMCPE